MLHCNNVEIFSNLCELGTDLNRTRRRTLRIQKFSTDIERVQIYQVYTILQTMASFAVSDTICRHIRVILNAVLFLPQVHHTQH